MKGFFKWFKSSSKMKRWILIILIGVVLTCYGIAKLIDADTLGTKEIVQVVMSFVFGFASIVLGFVFMQKRMLEIMVEESDTRKEKNNINTLIFNKKIYNPFSLPILSNILYSFFRIFSLSLYTIIFICFIPSY